MNENNIAADLIEMIAEETEACEAVDSLAENNSKQLSTKEVANICVDCTKELTLESVVNMLELLALGAKMRIRQIAQTKDEWAKSAMELKLLLTICANTDLLSTACGLISQQLAD